MPTRKQELDSLLLKIEFNAWAEEHLKDKSGDYKDGFNAGVYWLDEFCKRDKQIWWDVDKRD